MGRYLVRRLLIVVPTILGCMAIVFFAMRVLPGDPVTMLLGMDQANITPETLQRLREELGLNRPLPAQFLDFVGGFIRGDLGQSFRHNRPVMQVIADVFPSTVELAVAGFAVAATVGIVAGVVTATRQYSWIDNVVSVLVLVGVSAPTFWTALLVILLFGLQLGWFPIAGSIGVDVDLPRITKSPIIDSIIQGQWAALGDALQHLVLPALVLGLDATAIITRQVRSALLEVLRQDYIVTARSKGLHGRTVLLRHAFRNSLIPVATTLGLQVGSLLSGTLIIETIFARPGIGRLAVQSIQVRDYAVVQGVVLLSVVIFVVANLLVDLIYAYLDPRIRYS